jgi:L-threonylcarbamoyladenylate synthase
MTLALLRTFGGGLAAPSANRFGAVSHTEARHVRASLGNAVDMVLDGGPCQYGLESTIVSLLDEHQRGAAPRCAAHEGAA